MEPALKTEGKLRKKMDERIKKKKKSHERKCNVKKG